MKLLVLIALIPLALIAGIIAFALVFGGPSDPPPMPSINNPFKNVDFSDMAATRRFAARFVRFSPPHRRAVLSQRRRLPPPPSTQPTDTSGSLCPSALPL